MKSIKSFFIFSSFLFIQSSFAATHTLKVFSTRQFAKNVGKKIKKKFLEEYDCDIKFISYNGTHHMLTLIKRNSTNADMVIGVFHDNFGDAKVRKCFIDLPKLPSYINVPHKWEDSKFWPIYYGTLAFVYNSKKVKNVPTSFKELCDSDHKIVIMDPRISNVGLSLMLWIEKISQGKEGGSHNLWKKLKPRILTITKRWSEAYSLFIQGEAPICLAYTTSPMYHRLIEKVNDIKAANFKNGHYISYGVAGILKTSRNKKLAKILLDSLFKEEHQKDIVYREYNYPVISLKDSLPKEYLETRKILNPLSPVEVFKNKEAYISSWLNGLS